MYSQISGSARTSCGHQNISATIEKIKRRENIWTDVELLKALNFKRNKNSMKYIVVMDKLCKLLLLYF